MKTNRGRVLAGILLLAASLVAHAESGDADLAQKLANPLANLISLPIQMNIDQDLGPGNDGTKVATNVQPVIPFDFSDGWSLISRTIVPIVYQDDVFPGAGPVRCRYGQPGRRDRVRVQAVRIVRA
jgi:hypothetical protein